MSVSELKNYIDCRVRRIALTVCLLLLPSLFRWFLKPFSLIDHDLNLFIGLVSSPYLSAETVIFSGWILHAVAWFLVAQWYLQILLNLRRCDHRPENPWLLRRIVCLALLYFGGLPYLSPDVFFYLGKGWLDYAYGINAFEHRIVEVPAYQSVAMFKNIAPICYYSYGNYGDIFHWLAKMIAAASGGNQIVALLLFKILALFSYLVSLCAIAGLARNLGLNSTTALWAFGANPLILFNALWTAHNDVFILPCLLFTIWMALLYRPVFSGFFLAVGFCIKLVPILTLPFLCLWFLRRGTQPIKNCLYFVLTILLAIAAFNTLNGAGLSPYLWNPYGGIRGSVMIPLGLLFRIDHLEILSTGLKGFFCLTSAWVGWRMWKELGETDSRVPSLRLVRTMGWVFCFYLVIVSPIVTEWYLLWFLPLWAVVARQREIQGLKILSSLYLPLVIFSMYPLAPTFSAQSLLVLTQLLLYFLLLFTLLWTSCSPKYFRLRTCFR